MNILKISKKDKKTRRRDLKISIVGMILISIPMFVVYDMNSIQISHFILLLNKSIHTDSCSKKCLNNLPENMAVLSNENVQAFYLKSTKASNFLPFAYIPNKDFCSKAFSDEKNIKRNPFNGKEIISSKDGYGYVLGKSAVYFAIYYCMNDGDDGVWAFAENDLDTFKEYMQYETEMKNFFNCKKTNHCLETR